MKFRAKFKQLIFVIRSEKKVQILIFLLLLFFVAGTVSYILISKNSKQRTTKGDEKVNEISEDSLAVKAGKLLSNGNCKGEGSVILGTSPMKPEDFAHLEPYGLMVGNHVTPIDHQYFAPADRNLPRDSYEVYAMAKGKIIEIQHRLISGENQVPTTDEYRIVFMHTCTFFTYYDLVTSLTPKIKAEFDIKQRNNYASNLDIPVEEGQLIGRIGGQTLDFAVWDTEKPLSGFVVPEHYQSEPWKIYTADPYDYYTEDLEQLLTQKNIRTVEPIAGKIDYDIDGRLIGNWFIEGTGGYGSIAENYWETHLSIVPNHLDPDAIIVSVGDFAGEPKQFAVVGNSPDPSNVSVQSGLIKYELVNLSYIKPNSEYWDRHSLAKDLKLVQDHEFSGTILLQMISERRLKIEIFQGKRAADVQVFTATAKVYER